MADTKGLIDIVLPVCPGWHNHRQIRRWVASLPSCAWQDRENSISLLRKFHSGFNESSDSAYIVGVMDGFFKCLDEELLK